MNMLFRCPSHLIVAIALTFIVPALVVPTFASASDIAPGDSFKLAMGPTSAAQKNQGTPAVEATPVEPHLVARHRHSHHRPRHRHPHHMG
ncbi:MAG: hypothetical protein ABSG88_08370 [Bradyrhizobium sp.]